MMTTTTETPAPVAPAAEVKAHPLQAAWDADSLHEALKNEYEAQADPEPAEEIYFKSLARAVALVSDAVVHPDFPIAALTIVPAALAAAKAVLWVFGSNEDDDGRRFAGRYVPDHRWFTPVNAFRVALARCRPEVLDKPMVMESVKQLLLEKISERQIANMTGISLSQILREKDQEGSGLIPENVADYPAIKRDLADRSNEALKHLDLVGELRLTVRIMRECAT